MTKFSERPFGTAEGRVGRRQAAARQHIIDAAVRAFARRGFDSATMRDVAQEAGYTPASLYTYFRSKQEIAEALMLSVAEEFLASYDVGLPPALDFPQRLELLLHQQFTLAEKRREAFTVFLGMEQPPCVPLPGERERVPGPLRFVERLRGWLADAGAEALRGHDLDDLAHAFFGIGHGFVLRWLHRPEAGLVEHAGTIVRLFLHGISAPVSKPAAVPRRRTTSTQREGAGRSRAPRRTRSARS